MARIARVGLLVVLALAPSAAGAAPADPAKMPTPQLLWPAGAPGAKGDQDEDKPALWVFLPPEAKAVGTAVVVIRNSEEVTVVRSLAESLDVLLSPPPETVATLRTPAGASAATFTVTVMAG